MKWPQLVRAPEALERLSQALAAGLNKIMGELRQKLLKNGSVNCPRDLVRPLTHSDGRGNAVLTPKLARRSRSLAHIAGLDVITGLFGLGCEEDTLAPTGGFRPEDCKDINSPECKEGGVRIDAGLVRIDAGHVGGDAGDITGGDAGDITGGDAGDITGGDSGTVTMPDAGMMGPIDSGIPPDAGFPPSEFLDLTGTYPTEYVFDVSDYLFGISQIGGGLDFIDQALRGNIDLGNSTLNRILRPLLAPFFRRLVSTPNGMRLATVIGALNQIAHLFEEIEARGQITITQSPPASRHAPTTAIQATEIWTVMYMRMIRQCPDGRMTRSPPHPLPYPDCARYTVPITNSPTPIMSGSNSVDMRVYIRPFTGTLNAGVPEADFIFENREVEMEFTKLILLAIDIAIRLSSGGMYQGLEDLFRNTVCIDVADEAERLARANSLTRPFASLARRAALDSCVDLLVDNFTNRVIGGIGVDWDAFEFDQSGRAIDRTGDHRPEVLQDHSVANSIQGRFRFVGSARLRGTWKAP